MNTYVFTSLDDKKKQHPSLPTIAVVYARLAYPRLALPERRLHSHMRTSMNDEVQRDYNPQESNKTVRIVN